MYYLNNHHCCKLMAFPYPGFTRETRKAEEMICWEVGEREATWSYSWNIYCLSQIFMGFRRDLNEVLGWKLNWEAVPYAGEDGIEEWTVWQLDFDSWWIFFYSRVWILPHPLQAAWNMRPGLQGVIVPSCVPVQVDGEHLGSFSSFLWTTGSCGQSSGAGFVAATGPWWVTTSAMRWASVGCLGPGARVWAVVPAGVGTGCKFCSSPSHGLACRHHPACKKLLKHSSDPLHQPW